MYCLSRDSVERIAAFLSEEGVGAVPYHAGLDDSRRAAHQEAFARDEVDVVVATVAFGMGIDKPDVRFVIHRDMPPDIESWYQELGRAGRDGLPSECFLFYSWADVKIRDGFLTEVEEPRLRRARRAAMRKLYRLADGGHCRHQRLLAHFDEDIPPCGDACDVCAGVEAADLTGTPGAREAGQSEPGGGDAAGAPEPRGRDPSHPVFQELRTLRKELAEEQDVPAYVVFSDRTLWDMVDRRPSTPREMLRVHGVGQVKLDRYGQAFLDVLREAEEGKG